MTIYKVPQHVLKVTTKAPYSMGHSKLCWAIWLDK